MDSEINIDVNLMEVGEFISKAFSALLTYKEFTPSLSLFRAENKTFLETRYTRYYPAEFIDGKNYDYLAILNEAFTPRYDYYSDYRRLRHAFIKFISMNVSERNSASGKGNWFEWIQVNNDDGLIGKCTTPPWTIEIHTSQLSTTKYTPVKLPVTAFKVTMHYLQDCNKIRDKCDGFEMALNWLNDKLIFVYQHGLIVHIMYTWIF